MEMQRQLPIPMVDEILFAFYLPPLFHTITSNEYVSYSFFDKYVLEKTQEKEIPLG
jgi:hypothetical protein